jgi:hypothetical protein
MLYLGRRSHIYIHRRPLHSPSSLYCFDAKMVGVALTACRSAQRLEY